MRLLFWLKQIKPLPRFLLTRGAALSCMLLSAAILFLWRAGQPDADTFYLLACADYIQDTALVFLGSGLCGAVLVEYAL